MPKDNELLVRVRAASLNFIDAGLVRGPSVLRLMSGLRKPKFTGFGRDFAGVVEAVGKDVTEFKPGDEVFGVKWGAIAEYVCARKDRVALKPANITFEQASCGWARGPDCAAGAAHRKDPRRPESADQRRVWRRRDVRSSDREGIRHRGYSRVQHA